MNYCSDNTLLMDFENDGLSSRNLNQLTILFAITYAHKGSLLEIAL